MSTPDRPEKPRRKSDSAEKPGAGDMPHTQHHASTDSQTDSVVPQTNPEDDILDVLSEFETGLESLKALYVQRQKLQTRIRDQEERCKEREQSIAQRAAEVERAAQEQQQRAAELEEARARLDAREQELAAARQSIERDQAAVSQSRHSAEQAAAHRSQALEAQARKLAEDSQAVAQLTGSLDTQARELDHAREQFRAEQEARRQEWAQLESFRDQAARQRSALEAQESRNRELSAKVEAAGKQLEQARAEAQRFAQHAAKLESSAGAATDRIKDAAAAREQAEAQVRHLTERVSDLEAKWTQEKSQSARLTAAIAQHQSETAELEKVLGELRTRFQEEVQSREQLRKQLEAAEQSLSKANSRAEALQTKLTALLAEVAAFKEQAEKQAAAPKVLMPSSTASMLRRRQRLKLYRELVRDQSLKVRKANDALKKKVETCEQVLAHRAELANIRDRVLEAERRLQRRQAGSRAAVTLLCTVAVFALVAAMAWTLARQVAPATYMASSSIKADGRGRDLNTAELQEWTSFHESLLNDPRFHETAADRFKRSGLAALATPEAVADLVRNDVTTETLNPGEMQIHLKGEGADRTRRELETFTAALASHANALEQKRIDGALTAVSMPASASDEPLDNTRMMYFLGMMAAGVALCVAFVVALWKRLAGAKTAFEQDEVVTAALDETKWAAFAAATAAQQGSMAVKNKAARG